MRTPGEARAVGRERVVTVGTYDGVHLGHRRLVAETVAAGRRAGLPVAIVTFDRLPAEVVRPDRTPPLLTGLEHRLELLESLGADEVVVLHFDEARAAEPAEDFVAAYLCGELGAAEIFVGTNFRFGHAAAGDLALLERLGPELGFVAHGVELVTDDASATVVSSTRIRTLIVAGELDEAARLLGRPHEVRGALLGGRGDLVVHGALALPPPGRYPAELGVPRGAFAPVVASVPAREVPSAELVLELRPVGAMPTVPHGATAALRFRSSPAGFA